MIRWQAFALALCALSISIPQTFAEETPVKKPDGKTADVKKPDGKTADVKKPDGKTADVKKPDGKTADVKKPEAKKAALKANAGLYKLPDSIALSNDQKAKMAEIQKEFEPKLAEIAKKADVLTDEQKAAMQKISQEAKKSGKKGKELQTELEAALKLTDEQKKLRIEAKEQSIALQKQIRERVVSILFDDQKKALEEAAGKKKKVKPDSTN